MYKSVFFKALLLIIIIAEALFSVNPALTSALPLKSLIGSVQKRYDRASTLVGAFKQISYLRTYKREQVSEGKVYMKKPGKMRWEYSSPDEQLIVSDGMILWFYMLEDQQVMKKDLRGKIDPATPFMFLMGQGKLRDIFDIKDISKIKKDKNLLPVDSNRYYLVLSPKVPQSNMDRVILGVNKRSFQVEETRVIDYFGNVTKVILTDIETGVEVPDKMFEFVPPKGVRVIEEESSLQ